MPKEDICMFESSPAAREVYDEVKRRMGRGRWGGPDLEFDWLFDEIKMQPNMAYRLRYVT